jgi:hypothetical protein
MCAAASALSKLFIPRPGAMRTRGAHSASHVRTSTACVPPRHMAATNLVLTPQLRQLCYRGSNMPRLIAREKCPG